MSLYKTKKRIDPNVNFHFFIDPTKVRDITIVLYENLTDTSEGRTRWRYTVTWQRPTDYNCAGLTSISPYTAQITNRSPVLTNTESYSFWVDSEENFEVNIWVRNNELFESDVQNMADISQLLRKFEDLV